MLKHIFKKYLKPTPINSLHSHYDFIIVGAGTSGCLLANRLTANSSFKVLLIEAGSKDDYFWINIPLGYLKTIGNKKTDWCYETVEEPFLNKRSLACPRGRAIGGSSSINGMIYIRGQKNDYDQWAQISGNEKWKWENILPLYKKIENYIPFDKNNEKDQLFHGTNGSIRVEVSKAEWEVLDIWREAVQEVLEIPKVNDLNIGNNFGSSYFNVTQKRGLRFSSADAFLHPIAHRQNLHVLVESSVERILIDKERMRVTGVEVKSKDKSKINIFSKKETILSAGSIGSPLILQLSGIGPTHFLSKYGINVLKDLPVGENLHDHLQLRLTYKISKLPTLNIISRNIFECMKIGLNYIFYRSGPITSAPSVLGSFGFSDNSQETPNLQWTIQPLSLPKFGEPLDNYNGITTSVCNIRPTSRGWVRITNPENIDNPKIKVNYLSSKEDQKIAIQSLKLTRQIMKSNSFKPYEPEETRPGIGCITDEELLDGAKIIGRSGHHHVGSCKMGKAKDKDAVVDSELKIIGLDGIRIVDSSIMPSITSGNTNAPSWLIGEYGAKSILDQYK